MDGEVTTKPHKDHIEPTTGGGAAILETATRLFARHGFAAVSMSEIARLAGVSKANIFHHFGSKRRLYLAALKTVCESTVGASLDEHQGSGNPLQSLQSFFATHLRLLLDDPGAAQLVLRELARGDDAQQRLLAEEVFSDHFTRLVAMVRDAQRQAILRSDFDPALLAFLMAGANVFFFETRAVTPHIREAGFASDPARYSECVFKLLMRGAARDPAQSNDSAESGK